MRFEGFTPILCIFLFWDNSRLALFTSLYSLSEHANATLSCGHLCFEIIVKNEKNLSKKMQIDKNKRYVLLC